MSNEPALRVRPARRADGTGGTARRITARELESILPHRYPFAFIDHVDDYEAGVKASGVMLPSRSSWYMAGHFPGNPVVPGVLLIEAMAQLAGVVMWSGIGEGTYQAPSSAVTFMLASVQRARFRRAVLPGDLVRLEVHYSSQFGGIYEFKATARVDQSVVADCVLQLGAGR
jgi:3-hydroxyacyl-[acyl-carrier-protein] dehydratase